MPTWEPRETRRDAHQPFTRRRLPDIRSTLTEPIEGVFPEEQDALRSWLNRHARADDLIVLLTADLDNPIFAPSRLRESS